jgi:hypothetical protein
MYYTVHDVHQVDPTWCVRENAGTEEKALRYERGEDAMPARPEAEAEAIAGIPRECE